MRTSFYMDCSKDWWGENTECRNMQELFAAKELVPENMLTCGDYDRVSGNERDPWRRQHYMKETNTGMWYHCCEQRNNHQFVYNSGPAPAWVQGQHVLDIYTERTQDDGNQEGPVGVATKAQKLGKATLQMGERMAKRVSIAQKANGMWGQFSETAKYGVKQVVMNAVWMNPVDKPLMQGKSRTDPRIVYNMVPARFMRCSLWEDTNHRTNGFGVRRNTTECAGFQQLVHREDRERPGVNLLSMISDVFQTIRGPEECRGDRFHCLRPYDGSGKRFLTNFESPKCIDHGHKDEYWQFPHHYQVTFI